jgi:hypothetical protein
MKCPSFELLMDYCQGLLNDNDAQIIAAHLASGCEPCAKSRQWYDRVRYVAASDVDPAPPRWVLTRAVRLFNRRPQLTALERIDDLIASLIFDSRSQIAVSGARVADLTDRQLLYRAGPFSIDLQISLPKQSVADLHGQVLRESEFRFESVARLSLELMQESDKVFSTVTDNFGKFTIKRIQPGVYELLIKTCEGSVRIPQFSIIEW